MLSEFTVYLHLGFDHIADWRAYDHLLFVAALCVAYPLRAWRPLLVLITAFTIGHSVTLVLATFDLLRVNAELVETLIPGAAAGRDRRLGRGDRWNGAGLVVRVLIPGAG